MCITIKCGQVVRGIPNDSDVVGQTRILIEPLSVKRRGHCRDSIRLRSHTSPLPFPFSCSRNFEWYRRNRDYLAVTLRRNYSMDWNNDNVLEFIHFYETEPILWDLRDPAHKRKHLVYEAWVRIKNKLSWHTTVDDMKKKKESLMAYYRVHLKKIKKAEDGNYQTNWFAFSAMHSFLEPIYDSRSTIDTQNLDVRQEYNEEVNTDKKEHTNSRFNSKTALKRKQINWPSEIAHAKRQTHEAVEIIEHNDEYELFGKLIASKLRKIKNPNTRDTIMNDMHHMIFQASMTDRVSQQNVQQLQSNTEQSCEISPAVSAENQC